MNDINMNFSPISVAYYRSSPYSRIQGLHLPSVHNNLVRPATHGCVPPLSIPASPHSHPPCLYLCPCHAKTHHSPDNHDRLEEVMNCLTQGFITLSQNYTALNNKLDSILDRLLVLTLVPTSPKSPPPDAPMPNLLPMAAFHLPANSKPHVPSFDFRFFHRLGSGDISSIYLIELNGSSLSVIIAAKVMVSLMAPKDV